MDDLDYDQLEHNYQNFDYHKRQVELDCQEQSQCVVSRVNINSQICDGRQFTYQSIRYNCVDNTAAAADVTYPPTKIRSSSTQHTDTGDSPHRPTHEPNTTNHEMVFEKDLPSQTNRKRTITVALSVLAVCLLLLLLGLLVYRYRYRICNVTRTSARKDSVNRENALEAHYQNVGTNDAEQRQTGYDVTIEEVKYVNVTEGKKEEGTNPLAANFQNIGTKDGAQRQTGHDVTVNVQDSKKGESLAAVGKKVSFDTDAGESKRSKVCVEDENRDVYSVPDMSRKSGITADDEDDEEDGGFYPPVPSKDIIGCDYMDHVQPLVNVEDNSQEDGYSSPVRLSSDASKQVYDYEAVQDSSNDVMGSPSPAAVYKTDRESVNNEDGYTSVDLCSDQFEDPDYDTVQ